MVCKESQKVLRVSREPTMSAGNVLSPGFIMTSLTANVVKGIKIKKFIELINGIISEVVTAVTLAY